MTRSIATIVEKVIRILTSFSKSFHSFAGVRYGTHPFGCRTCPFLILYVFLKICNDISDGNKLMDVVILDFNAEFLLAEKNKVGKLKGIDAEVVYKLGFGLYLVRIHGEIVYKHFFYFLKHCVIS